MISAMNPKHMPADKRREKTVETVVGLAGEQNPEEITTAAIAKRMNMTQGAIFRHFASKDEIWTSVMEWMAEKLLDRVDSAAISGGAPSESLRAIFIAHVDFIAAHPGVPRILFGQLQRAQDTQSKRMVQSLIKNYIKRLCVLIDKGKETGEFANEINSANAAAMFIGTIQGLVMQTLLSGDIGRLKTEAPGAFMIYIRGIRNFDNGGNP